MPVPATRGPLYIGLMSGTSMDGIDAALLEFADHSCAVHGTCKFPYPQALQSELRQVAADPTRCQLDDYGRLDHLVGECFRDAANSLLKATATDPSTVAAIGSHGQTIRHQPNAKSPFSLQIGDANLIATGTGIDTIADFRRRDLALGGEGAPLTPAFHHWLFGNSSNDRVVLNLGGIANITVLPGGTGDVIGFDTGPGNTLMDAWIYKQKQAPFDDKGSWAAQGQCSESLLRKLLADPYFAAPAPKSTGFEYFNLAWLDACIDATPAVDVQATLVQLTVRSVAAAIRAAAPNAREVLVCGGGSKNTFVMASLATALPGCNICLTDDVGLPADWVESAAFAWLAMRFLAGKTGNLPSVTGAGERAVLGCRYPGTG